MPVTSYQLPVASVYDEIKPFEEAQGSMSKEEKPDKRLNLKDLMQARETLERLWPDMEKTGKWFRYPEKLSLYLPEWLLYAGVLVGILLTAYSSHLESFGQILGMLCLSFIIFRFGFERGCIQGFKDALAAVQKAIDLEEFTAES